MDNRKILESLMVTGYLECDEDYEYKLEACEKTCIDFKYWIDKGKRYKFDIGFMMGIILDLMEYYNEDKEELKKFEWCFDFLVNTFVERCINMGMWPALEAIISDLSRDYKEIDRYVYEYDEEFGKYLVYNGKKYLITPGIWGKNLINEDTNEKEYENVVGIELNILNNEVRLLFNNKEKDFDYEWLNHLKLGKLKIVFFDEHGGECE